MDLAFSTSFVRSGSQATICAAETLTKCRGIFWSRHERAPCNLSVAERRSLPNDDHRCVHVVLPSERLQSLQTSYGYHCLSLCTVVFLLAKTFEKTVTAAQRVWKSDLGIVETILNVRHRCCRAHFGHISVMLLVSSICIPPLGPGGCISSLVTASFPSPWPGTALFSLLPPVMPQGNFAAPKAGTCASRRALASSSSSVVAVAFDCTSLLFFSDAQLEPTLFGCSRGLVFDVAHYMRICFVHAWVQECGILDECKKRNRQTPAQPPLDQVHRPHK